MESGIASGVIIDTVAITEELTKMKAGNYTFPGYEYEDISQEMWLMVHEASGRFDPTKVRTKTITFFNVHTNNRLNNLRRDKQTLDKPTSIDGPIIKEDNSFEESIQLQDLVSFIESRLPPSLKLPFHHMMHCGGVGVTSYMKKNVRDAVSRLMKKYRESNEE